MEIDTKQKEKGIPSDGYDEVKMENHDTTVQNYTNHQSLKKPENSIIIKVGVAITSGVVAKTAVSFTVPKIKCVGCV